ncbi:Ppx/GppA phosphatase family protein [Dactylosporangium cerinum]|uniref:Ppx/GppA phosphatase family protein n=1 Tax=Dactylosporangium cerinum TaxID=1434730 RepID=A0ABV9W5X4_9ACTN
MRLAVLDVGSNAAHLHVVDARPGGPPQSVFRLKAPTLLADSVDDDGALSDDAVDRLVSAVTETVDASRRHAVTDLIPLATATIRDATNVEEIRHRVREAAGIELHSLSGEDEARVTFLAVRRWLGPSAGPGLLPSAGPVLLLDIGGATAEIAAGTGELPDVAVSLPLGAARITRTMLPCHPARTRDVAAVHRHVLRSVRPHAALVDGAARPIATSKTFKQLARVAGADGRLPLAGLREWIPRLAAMRPEERATLPGVAASRSRQLLAGAVIAAAMMEALDLTHVDVCPWALREGLLLRRITELSTT